MLQWDDKYKLGHERIDTEHKLFLELIAEFQQAVARGADHQKLARTLNEIGKCAEFHFVSEENLMVDHAYPDFAAHAKLHAMLLSEFKDVCWRFRNAQTEPQQVFDFLFQWFALHVTGEDRKLASYLEPA